MEAFVYIMAGMMVVSAGLMLRFRYLMHKYDNIVTYNASIKTSRCKILSFVFAALTVLEVIAMFVVAVAGIIISHI